MENLRPMVCKLRKDAIIPTKRDEDAGYDLYAVWDKRVVIHKANEVKMYDAGIKIMFPLGYAALFRERGSTGIINLQARAGVFEGGYQGEYKILLSNGNNKKDIIFVADGYTLEEVVQSYSEEYNIDGYSLKDIEVNTDNYEIEKDEYGRLILYWVSFGVKQELAYLYPQSKAIVQMIVVKKEDWVLEEVSEKEIESIKTERGEGRLGSSGK